MSARIQPVIGVAVALGLLLEAFYVTRAYGATLIGFASGVALCAFRPELERYARSGIQALYARASIIGGAVFGKRPIQADARSIQASIQASAHLIQTPIQGGPQAPPTGPQWTTQPASQPAIASPAPPVSPLPLKHLAAAATGLFAGLGNMLAFLLRYWQPIVLILIALGVLFAFRGCARPFDQIGKSRGEIALEARLAQEEARTLEAISARDAAIAQAAQQAAVHRAQIELLLDQGRRDIESATPEHEEPIDLELERAWRMSLERLRVYPTADPNSPDPSGPGA